MGVFKIMQSDNRYVFGQLVTLVAVYPPPHFRRQCHEVFRKTEDAISSVAVVRVAASSHRQQTQTDVGGRHSAFAFTTRL